MLARPSWLFTILGLLMDIVQRPAVKSKSTSELQKSNITDQEKSKVSKMPYYSYTYLRVFFCQNKAALWTQLPPSGFLLYHSFNSLTVFPSRLHALLSPSSRPKVAVLSSSLMDLHFRYLLPVLFNITQDEILLNVSSDSCLQYCKNYGECPTVCLDYCGSGCPSDLSISKTKKFFVAVILVASIAFFLASCYVVYVKYFKRSTSRGPPPPQEEQILETHDEFVDEDHGPVIDHHIWHIRTAGLQPSVISSITVCKYKRGDGLVEGTDCAVCLSEFEEDETLRLLPKCSHAFHVPCIDTWLRSHTNCPVCRAPVVANTTAAASSQATGANSSSSGEEIRIAVRENIQESDGETESEDGEIRIRIEEEGESSWKRGDELNQEEDGMHPMRRSVSMDSLSALKIIQALPTVLPMESDGNSAGTKSPVKESGSDMGIVPKRVSGNQGLGSQGLLKLMASSSLGPSSLKRSFSCGAKLFLSRYNRKRSQSSDLPA